MQLCFDVQTKDIASMPGKSRLSSPIAVGEASPTISIF